MIDNTNPDKDARQPYLALAEKYGRPITYRIHLQFLEYPVRAFYFDIPKDLAFHLDDLRSYNIHRDHESKAVGKMPVHTWYKKMEEPKVI